MKLRRRSFLQAGISFPFAKDWLLQAGFPLRSERGYQPKHLIPAEYPRTEMSLDGQWLFQPIHSLGAANATDPNLDDGGWHLMSVPDFWRPIDWWLYSPEGEASREFVVEEQKRVGKYSFDVWHTRAGWYRHWIQVPHEVQGKLIVLRFTGVASVADVWWNGRHVGSHIGMFGPFECDVTPYVRYGGKNLLSVFVAAEPFEVPGANEKVEVAVTVVVTRGMIENLPHGDYDDSWASMRNGGIWSPVQLIISETVRIEDVFFRPRLDGAAIDITVGNYGDESAHRTLRVRLYDYKTGDLFYEQKTGVSVEVAAGKQAVLSIKIEGQHPKLWSPDFPNLYRLETLLEQSGQIRDRVEHLVGFRTFEVRGAHFYLNNSPYFLRGAGTPPYGCRPHDRDLAMKFMNLMHEGNQAMTRFHTSGATETWASAADIAGVGACVEGIWPWALTGEAEVPEASLIRYWQDDQLSLFRSLRNHPSILMWAINNEMRFHYNPVTKKYFDPNRERRLNKWKIISDTIKMTRTMDPARPIIASSEYSRSREEYDKDLKPDSLDDGDIDDIHTYNGWYGPSGLFVDVRKDIEDVYSQFARPLISQEASTGYPNNDTGYPVSRYIFPQYVAQAWLGAYVFDPSNPFLRFHAQTNRDWMEKIRRHQTRIAGWMLFSNCCWFRHVCDAKRIEPYPTYYTVRGALEPVLISLENPDRHFVVGERFTTDVYVVNDDARCRHLKGLVLDWSVQTGKGETLHAGREPMPEAPYYERVKRRVEFRMPERIPTSRSDLILKLELSMNGENLSQNHYPIVVVEHDWFHLKSGPQIHLIGSEHELAGYLESIGVQVHPISGLNGGGQGVVVVGPLASAQSIGGQTGLRHFIAAGGRVLFLNPTTAHNELFPLQMWKISDHFGTSTLFGETWNAPAHWGGECVSIPPGHALGQDLFCPDDLRWWNSGPTGPSVCEWAFDRPRSGEQNLIPLCEYIAPHGYLASPQEFEKYQGVVVFEQRVGKGKVIVSTLRLADDPVARRVVANLILYAAR